MFKHRTPRDTDRFLFVVEAGGASTFPIDMLRYDNCWPHSSDDATVIAELVARTLRGGTVQVQLKGCQKPTIGRWKSFGWTVQCLWFLSRPDGLRMRVDLADLKG